MIYYRREVERIGWLIVEVENLRRDTNLLQQ